MKIFLTILFAALISLGCSNQPPTAQTTNAANNSTAMPANHPAIQPVNDSGVVSSHSSNTEKSIQVQSNKAVSSESSPMARAIDVTQLNADIEKAEKNPKDKKALAKAYFARAFALTEAAQYRSALGDFRKGLKLDSTNDDAKKMHDEILRIFASINREPPKEGEEPPPLPFKKGE